VLKFLVIILFCFPLTIVADNNQSRAFKIGVLYWSMDIAAHVVMRKGLETAAKSLNDEGLATNGQMI